MEFDNNRPIYLQILDLFCARVLSDELKEEDRVPSVREFGAQIGVNPNTVMRSYEKLTDMGVIYNKRGIGYFVASGAKGAIIADQKKHFLEDELPAVAQKAKLLGISISELMDCLSI